jgi:hypothetical protein
VRIRRKDQPRAIDIAELGGIDVEMFRRRHVPAGFRSAAESCLRRACHAGWLQPVSLDGKRAYYQLTVRAVRWLRAKGVRISRAAARPQRPMTKAQWYARAVYCSPASGPMRRAYRPSHDSEHFPDLAAHIASGKADPLRQKLFYRDEDVVGLLLLDRGQRQFVERKAKPKVLSLAGWDSFLQLIESGRFRLTIVTVSAGRQKELLAELAKDSPEFAHEVVLLPEVARVLPTRRVRAGQAPGANPPG